MIDLVMDAIIGTKQNRYGSRPSEPNIHHLRCVIGKCIAQSKPIRILTGWGAHKGYDKGPYNIADLIDAMALHRFASLNNIIKQYHTPGITVSVFLEDYTRHMLTGRRYEVYGQSLDCMIAAYGLNYIDTVNESSFITDPNYGRIIHDNAKAIYNGCESAVGWKGTIDWDHYIQRAATENPDLSVCERRRLVSIFLGSILARVTHKIVPQHDIKISFVPYPKSLPDDMRRGRLEYKIKEDKHSKATTAPWTCFGVTRNIDWTTATVKEVCSKQFKCVDLLVNGVTVPALREK